MPIRSARPRPRVSRSLENLEQLLRVEEVVVVVVVIFAATLTREGCTGNYVSKTKAIASIIHRGIDGGVGAGHCRGRVQPPL
jgi:uncharacterized membrane protein